jgi:hypothetical protein
MSWQTVTPLAQKSRSLTDNRNVVYSGIVRRHKKALQKSVLEGKIGRGRGFLQVPARWDL